MLDEPAVGGWRQLGRPLRMPGLARLVVELCDALGETQVDVLGYSWGGALALQLARLAPQRVRRLTLASTSPGLGGQLLSPAVLALVCSPWPYLSRTYLTRIAPVIYGREWGRRGTGPAQREFARWLGYSPNLIDSYLQAYAISWWTSLPEASAALIDGFLSG
jgi:poly(3-hydroxyoctanoate) depolymerase